MIEQRLVGQRIELVQPQLDTRVSQQRKEQREGNRRKRKVRWPHAEKIVRDADPERQQRAAQQQAYHSAVRDRDRRQPADQGQCRVGKQAIGEGRVNVSVPGM